jgi:hypothetical protein
MMQGEFWPSTGPMCPDFGTSETSRLESVSLGDITGSTSSAGETPARRTAGSESPEAPLSPASAASSSGLLRSFARGLSSARIPAESVATPRGPGSDSGPSCDDWDTRFFPSDSGPVVLALTTNGRGCSCSPRYPTPTASSHNRPARVEKLVSRRERQKALGRNGNGFGLNLGQYCLIHGIPFTANLLESLMGFPKGWMDVASEVTVTPSRPRCPNGSGERSSKPTVQFLTDSAG